MDQKQWFHYDLSIDQYSAAHILRLLWNLFQRSPVLNLCKLIHYIFHNMRFGNSFCLLGKEYSQQTKREVLLSQFIF